MPQILIIQFRRRPEMVASEQKEYTRAVAGNATIRFVSGLDQTLDWAHPAAILDGRDGVILGGSGEFDVNGGRAPDDPARTETAEVIQRLSPCIAHMMKTNVPFLGICLGHQIIAEKFGGAVTNDQTQKKVGTYSVILTNQGQNDHLFGVLPGTFFAQYGHKDSVTKQPENSTVLAIGESCAFSALRYGQKGYTVQFHPELTAHDIAWKLKNSPGYLPEGQSAESVLSSKVQESPEASKLIPLWIERVVKPRQSNS